VLIALSVASVLSLAGCSTAKTSYDSSTARKSSPYAPVAQTRVAPSKHDRLVTPVRREAPATRIATTRPAPETSVKPVAPVDVAPAHPPAVSGSATEEECPGGVCGVPPPACGLGSLLK
jgi:hypothetical protein